MLKSEEKNYSAAVAKNYFFGGTYDCWMSRCKPISGIPFVVVISWTIVHQRRSSQNQNSFCWLPYAQGAHLWILSATMGLALIVRFSK